MEKTYGQQFFDHLFQHIHELEKQLDTKDGRVVKTLHNTLLFAKTLQLTFADMRDIAGMMIMVSACAFPMVEGNKIITEERG